MALQEGYIIVRPYLFDGNNFIYWKGKMQYYLMNDIDNWMKSKEDSQCQDMDNDTKKKA